MCMHVRTHACMIVVSTLIYCNLLEQNSVGGQYTGPVRREGCMAMEGVWPINIIYTEIKLKCGGGGQGVSLHHHYSVVVMNTDRKGCL